MANAKIAELRASRLDSIGLTPEETKEVESSGSSGGGVTAESWSAVVGRRARKGSGSRAWSSQPQRAPPTSTPVKVNRRVETSVHGVGRVPRSPVVLIKSFKEGVPDADIMRRVKDRISLKDFEISRVRFREAISGGVLMEVLDPDVTPDRVEALAGAIGSAVSGYACVSRPARRVELRLRGFDP